jgi:hypothetical protein
MHFLHSSIAAISDCASAALVYIQLNEAQVALEKIERR